GVILLVMLFGSHSGFISAFNRESANLFGSKNAYGASIAAAKKANGGAIVPSLGFSPFFGASLLLIPFLCFWILWPNWGATVFGAWFIGWAGTLFLSSTRVIFAAAFDRILPEKVADVSERRHVPYWALVLMLVPSVIVSLFYAYTLTFRTYILDATLVIAVTFFGTAIAAMVLPYRKKQLYQNSPIAKYNVAGIPLMTISAAITGAVLAWNRSAWCKTSL